MNPRKEDCNHPVGGRKNLKTGDGFHCADCGADIIVVPIGREPRASQTDQMSVSPKSSKTLSEPTADSIRLNGDQKERAKKDESKRRKEWLRGIESNAKRLVKNIEEAKALVEQAHALHRKFKDTVRESLPLLENVRYGFAHLRKDESIMGETTGDAWSRRYLNVSYDHLCRVINKLNGKASLLLTDGTKVVAPAPETTTATEISTARPESLRDDDDGGKEEENAPVVPPLKRKDGTPIEPAVYGPADAIANIKTFMDSTIEKMPPMDKGIVYRSLAQEIDDRLNRLTIVNGAAALPTMEAEGVPAN